jgi:hypothetical protein
VWSPAVVEVNARTAPVDASHTNTSSLPSGFTPPGFALARNATTPPLPEIRTSVTRWPGSE